MKSFRQSSLQNTFFGTNNYKMKGNALIGAFLLICCSIFVCCEKPQQNMANCGIDGVVEVTNVYANHPNGLRITITNTSDNSLFYTAVSDVEGHFSFRDVEPGEYTIDVQKEGYEWGWMKDDGALISSWKRTILLSGHQIKSLTIYMKNNSSIDQGALDITDMSGNPISRIGIPKDATMISFKLINGTQSSSIWELQSDYCFGSIRYQTVYVFSSFNVTKGTIAAGDNVVVVGYINPEVFSSDFELLANEISLFDGGSSSIARRITIFFEN